MHGFPAHIEGHGHRACGLYAFQIHRLGCSRPSDPSQCLLQTSENTKAPAPYTHAACANSHGSWRSRNTRVCFFRPQRFVFRDNELFMHFMSKLWYIVHTTRSRAYTKWCAYSYFICPHMPTVASFPCVDFETRSLYKHFGYRNYPYQRPSHQRLTHRPEKPPQRPGCP